jgi:putative tricarboxylic transport membrane protein
MDILSAYPRYTFGFRQFMGGIELIPLMIGVFAVSQILTNASKRNTASGGGGSDLSKVVQKKIRGFGISVKEFIGQLPNVGISTLIGIGIGILPGIGANISNLVAYAAAKKRSKTPEEFGKGCVDGIVAPETCSNATIAGCLIVLLALGIPGDNATAVILAGFQLHGLSPGPMLFRVHGLLIYSIFAAYLVACFVMLVAQHFGRPLFTKVLSVPTQILLPVVIAFCIVGSFSANNRIFDIGVMFVFGVVGYFLAAFKYPLAPMVVGFILGPILEINLRRSLMRTDGDWIPILTAPIAAFFFILTAIVVSITIYNEIKAAKKKKSTNAA